MSKNKNQFIEQIKEIIKEEIRRSLLQQNFSNTWTRVKRRLMCMGYNYEYSPLELAPSHHQTFCYKNFLFYLENDQSLQLLFCRKSAFLIYHK